MIMPKGITITGIVMPHLEPDTFGELYDQVMWLHKMGLPRDTPVIDGYVTLDRTGKDVNVVEGVYGNEFTMTVDRVGLYDWMTRDRNESWER